MDYNVLQTPWHKVCKDFSSLTWDWEGLVAKCQRSLKTESIQVRINKNTKHSPYHAMSFNAIKYFMAFCNKYTEENAISLPGRIPAYKQDNKAFTIQP